MNILDDLKLQYKTGGMVQKLIFWNIGLFVVFSLLEVVLKFSTKEQAIEYSENNNIAYTVIEPKKKEFVIKSYADNFLKN